MAKSYVIGEIMKTEYTEIKITKRDCFSLEKHRYTTGMWYSYTYEKNEKTVAFAEIEFDQGDAYICDLHFYTNDEKIKEEFIHCLIAEGRGRLTSYHVEEYDKIIKKYEATYVKNPDYKYITLECDCIPISYIGSSCTDFIIDDFKIPIRTHPMDKDQISKPISVGNLNLFFVDCEAIGISPYDGRMTEFGAVHYPSGDSFHGVLMNEGKELETFEGFEKWIKDRTDKRAVMVSDNPAYDFQWINYGFHKYLGYNPFGHSARRIGDFYAGLMGDFTQTQNWKKLRITKHDHNPVNDAFGNMEAFERLLKGER